MKLYLCFMKPTGNFFAILALVLMFSLHGTTAVSAIDTASTGNFGSASTWSSGTVPGNGDTLYIPSGVTVTLASSNSKNSPFTSMRIFIEGTFDVANGKKLYMSSNGTIDITIGGVLSGTVNGSKIFIGNTEVWSGSTIIAATEATTCIQTGCNTTATPPTLPVELLYFNAIQVEGLITAKWATATETNNDFFSLDLSANGDEWIEYYIESGIGNSNIEQLYSIEINANNSLEKMNFIRLSQTDYDGTNEILSVEALDWTSQIERRFFPNPTTGKIHLEHQSNDQLIVKSLSGEILFSLSLENIEFSSVNLNDYLDKGVYILVMSAQGSNTNNPFISKLILN
jgi:hypothetical protein